MLGKRKLTTDMFYALIGNASNKLLGFLTIAVLARFLDKTSMGEFFFAISVTSIVAMFTELGTSRYLVREVARDQSSAATHLARVLYIRLPLIGGALVLTNCLVWAFEPALLTVFVFTSVYTLTNDLYFAFGATLVAVNAIVKRVATGLVGPALLLPVVVIGTSLSWSFDQILMAHAASSVVMVWLAAKVALRIVGPLPKNMDLGTSGRVLVLALPFFALSVLALVHGRLDQIMLAAMGSYAEVASYAASYKLLEVSRFIIRPLTMVLFPVFVAAAATQDWLGYRENANRLLLGVAALGFVLLAVVVTGAHLIVPSVYGSDYQSSIPIAQVLFLSAPALFAGHAAVIIATSLYLDRLAIAVTALGVIANVGLNLIVIPRWGAIGASWTTLVSETFVTLGLLALIRSSLSRKLAADSQPGIDNATGFDTLP